VVDETHVLLGQAQACAEVVGGHGAQP
jgi:hypothetical protein